MKNNNKKINTKKILIIYLFFIITGFFVAALGCFVIINTIQFYFNINNGLFQDVIMMSGILLTSLLLTIFAFHTIFTYKRRKKENKSLNLDQKQNCFYIIIYIDFIIGLMTCLITTVCSFVQIIIMF